MKYLFCLIVFAFTSVNAANAQTKPTGEEVFSALFNYGKVELTKEPLCKADISLSEQLALNLSVSYESKNKTTIKSFCSPSKFDIPSGKVIDVWDCTVQVNETGNNGEFISSSTTVFSLTKDKHDFVKGSLRCR